MLASFDSTQSKWLLFKLQYINLFGGLVTELGRRNASFAWERPCVVQ